MEVHINNHYVESFVSRYAKDNASKVVKYLAIFGIHFLNSINKHNSSLSEMKALAKNILKSRPNEGKYINHELQVLKDELEKLSKRVSSNIGTMAPQQQDNADKLLSTRKQQQEDLEQYSLNKSPSLPTKFDTRVPTQKPPTAHREGEKKGMDRRGSKLGHIEEMNELCYDKESKARVSPSNRYLERQEASKERSITPKPNEIMHGRIEAREAKSNMTRHHLDDTQAKDILKEEGVVYFPKKQKEEKYQSGKKETAKDPLQGKSPFFGKRPQIEENCYASWNDNNELSSGLTVQSTKSPHFPQPKEDFGSKALSARKEKEHTKPMMASSSHKMEARGTRGSMKNTSAHKPDQKNKKSSAAHEKTKKETKPSTNKHNTLRMSQPTATPNYKNVESKIKDEINYHKELAKQYKKMKQSMGQCGFDEEPMMRTSSRHEQPIENTRDKFMMTDKDPNREVAGLEGNTRYKMPKTLESGNSAQQRSSLTNLHQQIPNTYEKAPLYSHHKTRNDKENFVVEKNKENDYKGSTSRGGILDIANSFLNSPFMQHISNIDTSLKESISGVSNATRTPAELKSSNGFGRSINGVSDIEDDVRLQSSNGFQQSRYSNWGNGTYQADKSVRSTGSILKDSTNRKYGEKDLRSSCNKDNASSLASSNFSNFLNEDMKGFYQKESLDQKKPKNAGLMVRFGSSENSSNVSFNGNEAPLTHDRQEKKSNFHKYEHGDPLEGINQKNNDGFSFEGNAFKGERMSMAQLH